MTKHPTKYIKGDPLFQSGVRGGFSRKAGRYLDVDGKLASRARAIQSTGKLSEKDFGGTVFKFETPISDVLSKYEAATSGFQIVVQPSKGKNTPQITGLGNILQAALDFAPRPENQPPANYMPPTIQQKMLLSRYFDSAEGDAHQVISLPIELLSRNINVQCPDISMRHDIEEWVEDHRLGEIGGELWRSMRVYGIGLPLEVTEDNGDLIDVVPLPPLSTHIGRYWSSMMITPDIAGEKLWSRELLEKFFPPAMFRTLMRHYNDIPTQEMGYGVPLSGDTLKPISDGAFRWEKYAMPMLSRGFRILTTRTVFQDAQRAIIEGYKSQFWVFTLGDADHPPLPEEINALKNVLGGMSGERTGTLVWRNSPFDVKILVPQGIDQAIGNGYAGALTRDFFRSMGVTSTAISGESPGILGSTSSGRGGANDMDVSIYMERCRYQAAQITDWMTYLVKKWLDSEVKYAKKSIAKTKLVFAPTQLEMEMRIKSIFLPIYLAGGLDHHTLMDQVSLDSDVVIANKKQEKPARDAGLLDPPTSFVQQTVNPAGESKTSGQTKPVGSPSSEKEINNKVNKGQPNQNKAEEELDEE